MFVTPDVAARIDLAEGRLCASITLALDAETPGGSFVHQIAGGLVTYGGPGAPSNKLIGAGFAGAADDDGLAGVEAAFSGRAASLQAEVSTLASPAFHAQLASRGYVPRGFENVLGRSLHEPFGDLPDGITVAVVRPSEVPRWVDVVATGFASADAGGVGGDAVPPIEEVRRWMALTASLPGFRLYEARIGGEVVGGGSIRVDGPLAQLCGAATLPPFRRRGVQTALLRARLADAAELGCELAVVTTQPASKSQQNVMREGFGLLYARQLLVKAP